MDTQQIGKAVEDVAERAFKTFVQTFFGTFFVLVGTAFTGVTDFGTLKTALITLGVACVSAAASAVGNQLINYFHQGATVQAQNVTVTDSTASQGDVTSGQTITTTL